MDTFGNDLSPGGQVLSRLELERRRLRNGECVTCAQKCFKKKFFKLIPLNEHGLVKDGRCLRCEPQDPTRVGVLEAVVAVSAPPPKASGRRPGNASRAKTQHATSIKLPNRPRVPRPTPSRSMSANGLMSQEAPQTVLLNSTPEHDVENSPTASSRKFAQQYRRESLRIEDNDAQQLSRILSKSSLRDKKIVEMSPLIMESETGEFDPATLSDMEREALSAFDDPNVPYIEVINGMLMNSTSTTVMLEGLLALSKIHEPSDEIMTEVRASCGFEVIVSAMGTCANNAAAQTNACKVLFVASVDNNENQFAIGDAGGIDAIADAMKEFPEDDIVLEGALLALSNLCVPEANVRNVLDANLVELTVGAMNGSVENCGVQEHGAAVLANLASHDDARGPITVTGGCNAIVVSMVVNPNDVAVQIQALHAVSNLCVSDDDKKVALADAGGIDAVIGAMQYHRDNAHIQEYGAWALSVLGMNSDNKSYIGREGGADVIVRSMWVHPENPEVQERGCRALWTLSVDPSNKYTIVDVGAISAVVSAMANHAGDCSIQEKGCGVLANLAANDDNLKGRIVAEEALDVVVMGMVLHGESEVLQERACTLLRKLCIPENIEPMIVSNVSPLMAVMIENFPDLREKAQFVLDQLEES